MNRRTFLAGTTGAFPLLVGCIADQSSESATPSTTATPEPSSATDTIEPTEPTTESATATTETGRRAERACNGTTFLSFYALESQFADQLWDRDRVRVGFNLGAGAHVILVVYENDTVLGTAHAMAPSNGASVVDGQPIPLKTKLSGEHTIRVVMYGDVNRDGGFDPETATPCRYEGNVIQAGPETIDFSAFSEDSTATPQRTSS